MILLAEHDEPSLAAKKKQRPVALETATSTPKNRVWNFFGSALGRTCSDPDLSWETATGSVQYSYENASGRAYYYTFDHLGSVREMTDGSGAIQARYDYDPYGRATLVSGSNLATFGYTHSYMHQTSGFNLFWFRTYDSNTGRWLSRDPSAERGGLNLYGYCIDSPIDYIDPLGLGGKNVIVLPTIVVRPNSTPPDQQAPPSRQGGYSPDSNVKLPRQVVNTQGLVENGAEGLAGFVSIIADLLSVTDYRTQYARGLAMCNKTAHTPGFPSAKCKCCVITMDEQYTPEGTGPVYGSGTGRIYNMPCSAAQKSWENTPRMERPGTNTVVEGYEDW